MIRDIEQKIKNWLDSTGAESRTIQIDLHNEKNEITQTLEFERSEVALKTCRNNWEVFHIAHSDLWPRMICSKNKLIIQESNQYITLKNEIHSFGYSTDEIEIMDEARRIKAEESTKEEVEEKIVDDPPF